MSLRQNDNKLAMKHDKDALLENRGGIDRHAVVDFSGTPAAPLLSNDMRSVCT